MALESREFFEDEKGVWLLVREPATGHIFVRHEAARVSHIELSTFLNLANHDPAHLALRGLIGSLIPPPQEDA